MYAEKFFFPGHKWRFCRSHFPLHRIIIVLLFSCYLSYSSTAFFDVLHFLLSSDEN